MTNNKTDSNTHKTDKSTVDTEPILSGEEIFDQVFNSPTEWKEILHKPSIKLTKDFNASIIPIQQIKTDPKI
jgi:CO dehydrogenase/acetyl-CoA synthase delta subunit